MKTCKHCQQPFKPISSLSRVHCYICVPRGSKPSKRPLHLRSNKPDYHICAHCEQEKPISEFALRSDSRSQRHISWCRTCTKTNRNAKRQQTKQKAVAYKGGKCIRCGYDKCVASLHFHHQDPQEKDFCIATAGKKSWKEIVLELDKCILVCANCHGELHGVITYHDNSSSFIHINGV